MTSGTTSRNSKKLFGSEIENAFVEALYLAFEVGRDQSRLPADRADQYLERTQELVPG